MKRVMEKLNNGFFVPTYLLYTDWTNPTRKKERETYHACINNVFNATNAIQSFTEIVRPDDLHTRYLLLYGVLQAFIIQQDGIDSLQRLFIEESARVKYTTLYPLWSEIRALRRGAVGHPAESNHRTITGIIGGSKEDWGVKVWIKDQPVTIRPYILSHLDAYEDEVLDALEPIFIAMHNRAELGSRVMRGESAE